MFSTGDGKMQIWKTQTQPYSYQMDESELMESLSFLPSSSLLFCDLEGFGGRLGTPESPTALGRLSCYCCRSLLLKLLNIHKKQSHHLAGRGGRPELSGVKPEDSLLEVDVSFALNSPSPKMARISDWSNT